MRLVYVVSRRNGQSQSCFLSAMRCAMSCEYTNVVTRSRKLFKLGHCLLHGASHKTVLRSVMVLRSCLQNGSLLDILLLIFYNLGLTYEAYSSLLTVSCLSKFYFSAIEYMYYVMFQ